MVLTKKLGWEDHRLFSVTKLKYVIVIMVVNKLKVKKNATQQIALQTISDAQQDSGFLLTGYVMISMTVLKLKMNLIAMELVPLQLPMEVMYL